MKHPSVIAISDYDYVLPDEKVAKFPLGERDQSKLLVYKNGQLSVDAFYDLHKNLWPGCLLVFNNSRVISARLKFENDNQKEIEIFCLEPTEKNINVQEGLTQIGHTKWNCLVGNFRRWKQKSLKLSNASNSLTVRVAAKHDGYAEIDFEWQPAELSFSEILNAVGNIPIPPYLNRKADDSDAKNYQTVYSSKEGSVAAPTAGLHFTEQVFAKMKLRGVEKAELTLHVGAGTFQPVKSEQMSGHQMHSEWIDVDLNFLKQLLIVGPHNTVSVGTTSLRTLESLYWMGLKAAARPNADITDLEVNQWDPYEGKMELLSVHNSLTHLISWMELRHLSRLVCKTSILIAPPYEVKMVRGLITNFHQPRSTLLLLVAAFTGGDWKRIYEYALAQNFRFLSYGDSSLLIKNTFIPNPQL